MRAHLSPGLLLLAAATPTAHGAPGSQACLAVGAEMQAYLWQKHAIMADYHRAVASEDVAAAKKAGNRLKHYTFTQVDLVKRYNNYQRQGCDFSHLCDATREECEG